MVNRLAPLREKHCVVHHRRSFEVVCVSQKKTSDNFPRLVPTMATMRYGPTVGSEEGRERMRVLRTGGAAFDVKPGELSFKPHGL